MSLKQKIQELFARLDKEDWTNEDLLAEISGLLDETTNKILLFQKEALEEFTKNKHDRYYAGKIDAYTDVFAILAGDKK